MRGDGLRCWHSVRQLGVDEEDQLRAVGLWTAASVERVLGMAATGPANLALHLRTQLPGFGFDRRPICGPGDRGGKWAEPTRLGCDFGACRSVRCPSTRF
jgi:hypothetical protein